MSGSSPVVAAVDVVDGARSIVLMAMEEKEGICMNDAFIAPPMPSPLATALSIHLGGLAVAVDGTGDAAVRAWRWRGESARSCEGGSTCVKAAYVSGDQIEKVHKCLA